MTGEINQVQVHMTDTAETLAARFGVLDRHEAMLMMYAYGIGAGAAAGVEAVKLVKDEGPTKSARTLRQIVEAAAALATAAIATAAKKNTERSNANDQNQN